MKSSRTVFLKTTLLAVATLVLSSCGGDSSSSPGGEGYEFVNNSSRTVSIRPVGSSKFGAFNLSPGETRSVPASSIDFNSPGNVTGANYSPTSSVEVAFPDGRTAYFSDRAGSGPNTDGPVAVTVDNQSSYTVIIEGVKRNAGIGAVLAPGQKAEVMAMLPFEFSFDTDSDTTNYRPIIVDTTETRHAIILDKG